MGDMADYHTDVCYGLEVEFEDDSLDCGIDAEEDFLRSHGSKDQEEMYLSSIDRASRGIWRCKNGEEIRVTDMKDDHLLNAVRMIDRKGWEWPYRSLLMEEVMRRDLHLDNTT